METLGVAMADRLTATSDVAVGDVARMEIRAVASSGAGVGDLPDGRVAFVHRTAPGDAAEVRITQLRRRWGRAALLRVLEPGPGRVKAPCPHYAACGGCTLQHLAYPQQLAWKHRFVADAMERIGHVAADVAPVTPSPVQSHYRNRVTFTLRRGSGNRMVAGFHGLDDPDHIVDVGTECLLPEPELLAAWGRLRALWRSGWPPLPKAAELRLTLRVVEEGVLLLVRGGPEGWDAGELLERVPTVVSVWHQPTSQPRPSMVAGAAVAEVWGEEQVPVAGEAFLQVNRHAAEGLVEHVLSLVGPTPGTAVDAYCGVGVYGRALARSGWSVTGIERDPHACASARHAAPAGFSVVEGAVEDHLAGHLPADLVILNPPRTGLQEWVPGILGHHRPPRVIYVSCDPATLARDSARMAPAYRLEGLRPFDLFPQTSHVETVAVFRAGREDQALR
ncbi:MAG: class I SAM-dependent RNA methyltransferase [Gemmatimonadota bacterium]